VFRYVLLGLDEFDSCACVFQGFLGGFSVFLLSLLKYYLRYAINESLSFTEA
jgi:hypothetical protein